MLVSIIIPTFNQGNYLREAILSAINQDMEVEVIVVNDGSTDDTINVCEEFFDKIKYYYKENGGTASALNVGIHYANGDWIKWLSSDDILLPDACRKMLEWTTKNQTAVQQLSSIYYTHYHIIDERGVFIQDFKEPGHPNDMLWKFFFGNGSTSLIHSEIFQKIGNFDSGFRHSEDYEFWLRATMLHDIKMTLIPLFTLNYRRHPEQLTNKVGGSLDSIIKKGIKARMG